MFSILTDYSRFADFIPNVLESRVLRREGETQWVYQRLGFPALVADRYYVVRSTGSLERVCGRYAHISWTLDRAAMAALPPAGVRPREFSGSWELQALPDGAGTRAHYTIHVDPGGRLPGWLFSPLSEGYVIRLMEAIRGRVGDRQDGN